MNNIDKLKKKRNKINIMLFFLRCLISLLTIIVIHIFLEKNITLRNFFIYIIAIPLGLAVYDKLINLLKK